MKLKTNTITTIDCFELDKVVRETYGRLYCFQQQDGCKDRGSYRVTVPVENPDDYENDTVPEIVNGEEMGVSFEAWLARDPKQKLKGQEFDFCLSLWWQRNFYPHIDMVLNDLYQKDLVDAGEYTIIIDW